MLARHGWPLVVLLAAPVVACGARDAPPSEAADTAPPSQAASSGNCASPGDIALPACVDSPTVNPNRVGVATIIETSSTNSDGYAFTLYDDGSAEGEVWMISVTRAFSRAPCRLPSATPLVVACLDWLARAGDIAQIPTAACGKSISFGTRTYVCYLGTSSPDLQCVDDELYPCKDFNYCTSLLHAPSATHPQGQDGGGVP